MSDLAYVLHQWDWSETSLVLDLFTREHGRLAAVARGAKRPHSQLRPVLLPFQCLKVAWTRARAPRAQAGDALPEVVNLKAAEYLGQGRVLPPARLLAGFYLNELLLKLLARGDPAERLFEHYSGALQALAEPAAPPGAPPAAGPQAAPDGTWLAAVDGPPEAALRGGAERGTEGGGVGLRPVVGPPGAQQVAERSAAGEGFNAPAERSAAGGGPKPGGDAEVAAVLRVFELRLLRELGVLPALDADTPTQRPVDPARAYRLEPEHGLLACDPHAPHALPGALCLLLHARMTAAPGAGDDAALRLACRPYAGVLRGPLRGMLDHQLGRARLHTRHLVQQLRATTLSLAAAPESQASSPLPP